MQRSPEFTPVFVGHELGEVRADNGFLGLTVDATFEDLPSPDVVLVPGGVGSRALQNDQRVLDWLRSAHRTSEFTTSVCTGSLVLGSAGLLAGLTATTHWGFMGDLEATGARAVHELVVVHESERIVTAAGVASGLDMALYLAECLIDRTAAQAMQMMIEYDPDPPYDCPQPDQIPAEMLERIMAYSAERE